MAFSLHSALSHVTLGRVLAFASANAGLMGITISVATAGILGFYVVSVPPGTIAYP